MSYGRSTQMFMDPVEAQRYLDSCKADRNQTAENYADRVAAQRCIDQASGWTPTPLPLLNTSKARASASPTRRATRAKR